MSWSSHMRPMASAPPLTLPIIAPPLPDVGGPKWSGGSGLVVVCPSVYYIGFCRAEEHDERQLRHVDLMNLIENLLPQFQVRCRHFLLVEGIQCVVTVEGNVVSLRWDLVAREQKGIAGII